MALHATKHLSDVSAQPCAVLQQLGVLITTARNYLPSLCSCVSFIMHAYRSPSASLPQATNVALQPTPPKRTQQSFYRISGKRQRLPANAATLKDLTLERTEHRTLAEPAAEDTLQHPSQVLDNRQLLQEYVHPLTLQYMRFEESLSTGNVL